MSLPNYDAWLERPYQENEERALEHEAWEESGTSLSFEDWCEERDEARADALIADAEWDRDHYDGDWEDRHFSS